MLGGMGGDRGGGGRRGICSFCLLACLGGRDRRRADSTAPQTTPPAPARVHFESHRFWSPTWLLHAAMHVQKGHDSTALSGLADSLCRTSALDPRDVEGMLPATLRCRVTELRSCGAVSRIYAGRLLATGEDVIIKVSSLTSEGVYEAHGYELLRHAGIPAPRIHWIGIAGGGGGGGSCLVLVLEKLECTLTSYLRASHTTGYGKRDVRVASVLHHLVHALNVRRVFVGDLSPDNIMLRVVGAPGDGDPVRPRGLQGGILCEFVVIDPQFCLPLDDVAARLPLSWALRFPAIHLILKIKALSLLGAMNEHVACHVCWVVSGCCPRPEVARKWLFSAIPAGLRATHGIQRAKHRLSYVAVTR